MQTDVRNQYLHQCFRETEQHILWKKQVWKRRQKCFFAHLADIVTFGYCWKSDFGLLINIYIFRYRCYRYIKFTHLKNKKKNICILASVFHAGVGIQKYCHLASLILKLFFRNLCTLNFEWLYWVQFLEWVWQSEGKAWLSFPSISCSPWYSISSTWGKILLNISKCTSLIF